MVAGFYGGIGPQNGYGCSAVKQPFARVCFPVYKRQTTAFPGLRRKTLTNSHSQPGRILNHT
jgi:hypothetical protein